MKRWHTIAIGLVISAVALYLAFRQADFAAIFQEFRTARYEYIVTGLVLIILTTIVRGWRWSILTQGRLSAVDGTWLFNAGFLFNNVLPAKLGEIVRAMLAGRRPRMHFTSALSSIVVERLFDMVSVVVTIGVVLIVLDLPDLVTGAGALMGIIALVGIVVLAVAARYPQAALRFGARVLSLLPRIGYDEAFAFLEPFVEGLSAVSDLRTFLLGLSLSLAAWLFSGFTSWVIMLAFWERIPFIMGLAAVGAAGLGAAIPAGPAGVGPFEAAIIIVLTALGYDQDTSRSYAIAIHFMNFAVTTGLGAIGLLREGVGFGEAARAAQEIGTSHQQDAKPPAEATP